MFESVLDWVVVNKIIIGIDQIVVNFAKTVVGGPGNPLPPILIYKKMECQTEKSNNAIRVPYISLWVVVVTLSSRPKFYTKMITISKGYLLRGFEFRWKGRKREAYFF